MTSLAVKTIADSRGLKAARLRHRISLRQAARETRIPENVIKSFEEGRRGGLPEAYESGLLASYCRYLGLRAPATGPARLKLSGRSKTRRTIVTADLARRGVFIGLAALVIGYGLWQTVVLVSPPRLTIESPKENSLTSENSIMVTGRTSPGADVYINNEPILIEPDGRFREKVSLSNGLNEIEIRALNTLGRRATARLTVVVRPASD